MYLDLLRIALGAIALALGIFVSVCGLLSWLWSMHLSLSAAVLTAALYAVYRVLKSAA